MNAVGKLVVLMLSVLILLEDMTVDVKKTTQEILSQDVNELVLMFVLSHLHANVLRKFLVLRGK